MQKLSFCLVMAAACRGTEQNHLTSHSSPSLTASLFTVVWAFRSHNFLTQLQILQILSRNDRLITFLALARPICKPCNCHTTTHKMLMCVTYLYLLNISQPCLGLTVLKFRGEREQLSNEVLFKLNGSKTMKITSTA